MADQFRNLSGIFFREKVGDNWENVCFEELTEKKQEEVLKKNSKEWVESLAKQLAKTIVELGNFADLQK